MANPPTALGMAIDLTHTGVYTDADRSDEGGLAYVGTEAGPEVVVQVGPTMECAGVKSQPMSYEVEEGDEKGNSHHKNEQDKAKGQPPRVAPAPGVGVDARHAPVASEGQRS